MSEREHSSKLDIDDIGYIYIMTVVINGRKYLKIGKTIDTTRRLLDYNRHLPVDICSYDYVSDLMYNISTIENNILFKMKNLKHLVTVGNKREWFSINRGAKGAIRSMDRHISSLVLEIEDYATTYYQEKLWKS